MSFCSSILSTTLSCVGVANLILATLFLCLGASTMSPGLPNSLSCLELIGPITDFKGIPVSYAVSIILVLEKCAAWALNQSTQWCRLKSSCDTCLSLRVSANSCLHSRSSRSISFILSRYRVRLVSVGFSTLL